MPNFLADTSFLIDIINDRNGRREFLRELLQPGDTIGCCTVNWIEIYTGMRPGEERVTEAFLGRFRYYDVTRQIAVRAGRLRYEWRRQGQTLSLADATIAAVAIHLSLALPRTGGRAHLLSRRAADALGAGKRRHQTPGRGGHSAGRLEGSQRGRSPQPGGDGNLPVCANCHSFSADGKTMGMDLDGLQGNRGMYILAPVAPQMAVRKQDVIQWSSPEGKLKGNVRIGFMSQVSPDGQYVVTTVNPAAMAAASARASQQLLRGQFQGLPLPPGVLSHARDSELVQPPNGSAAAAARRRRPALCADGRRVEPRRPYLVFARAQATDPNPPGVPLAKFANDPNELQISTTSTGFRSATAREAQPEPIAGASRNGMSNTFPKVSPDGRWIVFVQCRNGELMRPDSQLYIVPAAGGRARRMRCNTPRMNSWHSFSPNGRWLVFSSKAGRPTRRCISRTSTRMATTARPF
jgi:predicted nucleic acid-binding protein